jgi:hypothetical protein
MGSKIVSYSGTKKRSYWSNIIITAGKKSQIYQQRLCDGKTVAWRQPVGSIADKPAVDFCKRVVQLCQINDVLLGDGGQVPKIFFAKAN